MLKLARYLKAYKKNVILGPIFKLIEAVFELIIPVVTAKIIDVGVKTGDTGYVFRMGGVMLLLGAVGLASALTCQRFAAYASQGFGTTLRNEMFAKINSFSHAEIDRFGTSSLITRITNDVNQLQTAVAMLIRLVVRAPFLAIGAVVAALMLDLKLSIIFLIAMPLIALALYIIMSKTVPLYRMIQKKLDRISLISRENLGGARVIRAFSKQEEEAGRFEEANRDFTKTAERVGKISALLNPLTFAIMNLGVIAILWFGGFRVDNGELSQGQIIAFVNYMNQILLALMVVANLVVLFTKAAASAHRVNEVLDTNPSVLEQEETKASPVAGAPRIEFDHVSFAYSSDADDALKDITFRIEPGETVGIIGGTGSGKSTLVNLIPRFYDATGGAVRVDGVDVKDYPFLLLRQQIGMVPQAAVVFSGTIAENMRWAKEDATEEEIRRAIHIAQAEDFVSKLPLGLATKITQGGKNLSGGQRQRLTIARALVGSPQILILDDSASALDFATDAALRRSLRKETQGMTVIMVSQRASTVKSADKILVLDDGNLAGMGTHEELLKNCPEYKEICLSQMSEEEAGK